MSIQLRRVAATSEPHTYQVLLEVGLRTYVYVVHVEREPIPNVSAPHPFWMLCESNHVDPGQLLAVVKRVDSGDQLEFPIEIEAISEVSKPTASDARSWRLKSGAYLSATALNHAVSYFSTRADTSLFPRPFEYSVMASVWDALGPLAQQIDLSEHSLGPTRAYLAPKSAGGSRNATQLDPLDTLLLTAAVFELGPAAEQARVPVAEGVVHSFRFSGTEELWDPTIGYASFQERSRALLDEYSAGFVAETDISSFYHRIPVDVVAAALERSGGDRRLIEGVRRLLCSFAAVGLPVGPTPSAFFAEVVLNEVDAALLAAGARFIRFNDDYRFFCKTEAEARLRVELLASLLWQTAGLSIQEAKTKIFAAGNYRECIAARYPAAWLKHMSLGLADLDPYADPAPVELTDQDRERIDRTRHRLLEAIGTQHLAWIKTSQKALAALPLRERVGVIPRLLDQLARLKAIARDISASIAACGLKFPEERSALLGMVVHSVRDDPAFLRGPDYSRTWLMRAFNRADWPDVDQLLGVAERWPSDHLAKREIILALRGSADLLKHLDVDMDDPWLRRAMVAASGKQTAQRGSRSGASGEKWDRALDALVAGAFVADA
ncbi:MAG TPA: RNA-directed DNA polymerase [Kofleriaceae bacterium]|jgi:hypothetical protein|nr:RNA-directed DNA polymerase [Kofleriaceae bacterium]